MFSFTRRPFCKPISSTSTLLHRNGKSRHFSIVTLPPHPIVSANMRPLRPLSAFLLHQSYSGNHRHHFSEHLTTTLPLHTPIISQDVAKRFSSSQATLKKAESIPKLGLSKSAKARMRKQKIKLMMKEKALASLPTTGPTGRPIVTESLLQNDPVLSSLPYDMASNHPKNILNGITKHKLQFVQHVAFDIFGPQGDQLFLATTTTSFEINDATTELICSGLGRSKKTAEFYAAMDLIAALQEMNIDAENPPDVKMERKRMYEQKLKENVARAQMLLEVLNSSRPQFTVEAVKGGWQATVSLWVKGEFFTAVGAVGKNKANAEGLALLELVNGRELNDTVNAMEESDVMQMYSDIIEASPGKHIAGLRVPPLPTEVVWDMLEVVGPDNGKHEERMREHERIKAEYEEKYGVGGKRKHRPMRKRQSRMDYDRINEALKQEEEQKTQREQDNPEGKQAQMKALREALPITAIRQGLLDALKTDQVVVVSGGTGSGKSTQCPQYILEDALLSSNGAQTEIIVTQPRKIAAVSVAERVADERHEKIGNSVGYSVRFLRKQPREAGGTIEFVTTGVLLNRMMNDPLLDGVSHVIIDEGT